MKIMRYQYIVNNRAACFSQMVFQASWSASRNSPLSAYSQSFLLSAGLKHDQRKVNIHLKQHIPSCYNQAFISYIDIKINSIVDFWIFYL